MMEDSEWCTLGMLGGGRECVWRRGEEGIALVEGKIDEMGRERVEGRRERGREEERECSVV